MLDSIRDYASSTVGTAIQRIKNPAFGAFSLSWIVFNWKQILYLFLSNTDVLDKIDYVTVHSTWKTLVGYPAISVIVFCGFVPWLNYIVATWQMKPIDHTDSIDNRRKARMIQRSTRLQRLQAKHDVTYDKYKTGAEKDIQSMKEQIAQSQDRMGELTAQITAKDEELRIMNAGLDQAGHALDEAQNSYAQLSAEYGALHEKYDALNLEFTDYKSRYFTASGLDLTRGFSAFHRHGSDDIPGGSQKMPNVDGIRSVVLPNK